jgi:hypothetical protein
MLNIAEDVYAMKNILMITATPEVTLRSCDLNREWLHLDILFLGDNLDTLYGIK